MGFLSPDEPKLPKPPPPPPTTPTRADSSVITAGRRDSNIGLRSLITTGSSGLARKASTQKRSLIGGS